MTERHAAIDFSCECGEQWFGHYDFAAAERAFDNHTCLVNGETPDD